MFRTESQNAPSVRLNSLCKAHKEGREMDFPVKKKAKARRIEKRTVFIFRDNEKVAIRKRPQKGLLAGMYEFPNVEGHLAGQRK